jgi:hypothetical protein
LVDVKYRNQGVESDKNIDQALLRVYSAMLDFAAEVKKDQDENEVYKHNAFNCARQSPEYVSLIIPKLAPGIASSHLLTSRCLS